MEPNYRKYCRAILPALNAFDIVNLYKLKKRRFIRNWLKYIDTKL